MPRKLESDPDITGFRESWQVYRRLIRPIDNVAVIGPGESLFTDPTLVTVAQIMAGGSGELVAVDPKHGNYPDQIEQQPVENRVLGVGYIETYLEVIRTLQFLGMDLKIPLYNKGSHALNFQLPEGLKLDFICDHDLSPFLVNRGQTGVPDRQVMSAEYLKIYGYYQSQLKPGGKLILQTDNYERRFESDINNNGIPVKRVLSRAGFRKIDYFNLEDVFEFEIPRANLHRFDDLVFIDRWRRSHYQYDYRNKGEAEIIRISLTEKPYGFRHPSPDMYIATK